MSFYQYLKSELRHSLPQWVIFKGKIRPIGQLHWLLNVSTWKYRYWTPIRFIQITLILTFAFCTLYHGHLPIISARHSFFSKIAWCIVLNARIGVVGALLLCQIYLNAFQKSKFYNIPIKWAIIYLSRFTVMASMAVFLTPPPIILIHCQCHCGYIFFVSPKRIVLQHWYLCLWPCFWHQRIQKWHLKYLFVKL